MHNIINDGPTCMDVATSRLYNALPLRIGAREVAFGSLKLLISLHFERLAPVTRKLMVGAVGDFTLQSMGRTKHKFPDYKGPGVRSEVKSTQASVVEK